MNFLRTASPRRLVAGAALAIVLVAGGVAVAGAANSGGSPPPAKALPVAIHDALTAPAPDGITARIRFTNNLVSSGALSVGSPLVSGASGRLWMADGRVRLELQSDSGDAQIAVADGKLSVYDASSNTVYRADLGAGRDGASANSHDRGQVPTVAEISSGLTRLAGEAGISGAEPTTQAGQPAYNVTITPKHDAGLLGQAAIAWDAARGIPLRIAITAAGDSTPVLALEATDISYGKVDASALTVSSPPGATIVDLGSLSPVAHTGSGHGESTQGLSDVQAALPFTLAAPDTLVGLPRTGVRLIGDGDHPAALVTYGKGLGALAVLERATGATAGKSPLDALPAVTIDGATGHELPTALGTLVSVQRGGVSYTLVGSLPPNAAETALRAVLA